MTSSDSFHTGLKQGFRSGWEVTMFVLRFWPVLVLLALDALFRKIAELIRR